MGAGSTLSPACHSAAPVLRFLPIGLVGLLPVPLTPT